MKRFLTIVLLVGIVGAAGYFGYQYYLSKQEVAATATEAPAYQEVAVRKGSLSQSVTGTGSVKISETKNVNLEYAITVSGTLVETGEKVEKGQEMLSVDRDKLEDTVTALESELDTCESEMASISNGFSNTTYVKMPLEGRVKEVYMQSGQYIQDVMAEKGSIALLSLDGWMLAEVSAAEGMAVNDRAKVKVGRTTLDATVREMKDGKATVSFSDAYGSQGGEVEVFYNQQSLGLTAARISMPYQLTTTEKGYISGVYMEVNDRKWEGNRLAYLTNVPVSSEYQTLQTKRDQLTRQITEANQLLTSGTLASPIEGIVSSISEASTQELAAYTTLASLYVGDQKEMVVSVDELDIVNVQVGQEAEIKMDAVQDTAYSATVARISQIGTSESGVTVYNVTLSVNGDERLRIGMNGTATIKIKEANDVLLIPIAALNTSRDGQYVWVKGENLPADSEEPGQKTFVTTGMSNENFVEVLTGLAEGDTVLVTREGNTNSGSFFRMGVDGGMMMNFGGGPAPEGGQGGRGGGNQTFVVNRDR